MTPRLDRRVTIYQRSGQQDATFGAAVPDRVLYATVWAEVYDLPVTRSAESLRMGMEIARNLVRVRVRYDDGIDAAMEIVDDRGRSLKIVAGPNEIGRREYLELLCEATSTQGGA